MTNPYRTHKGSGLRVANAAAALRILGRDGVSSAIHTRSFDNCFENADGNAVIWALMRKALSGDRHLEQGIRLLGRNENVWKLWLKIYQETEQRFLFDAMSTRA